MLCSITGFLLTFIYYVIYSTIDRTSYSTLTDSKKNNSKTNKITATGNSSRIKCETQ